jgi:hypothetical protein
MLILVYYTNWREQIFKIWQAIFFFQMFNMDHIEKNIILYVYGKKVFEDVLLEQLNLRSF